MFENIDRGIITGRKIEEYLEDLKLSTEDLKGKVILDIGAGTREFAKNIEEQEIEAKVFSLSPNYGDMGYHKEIIEQRSTQDIDARTVAGTGESLPFSDDTFDLVLAEYSLPYYSRDIESLKSFFAEVKRVVKPGGEVRIYPLRLADGLIKSIFVEWEVLKVKIDKGLSTKEEGNLFIIRKK